MHTQWLEQKHVTAMQSLSNTRLPETTVDLSQVCGVPGGSHAQNTPCPK